MADTGNAVSNVANGAADWLKTNAWWLIAAIVIVIATIIVIRLLGVQGKKRLQRDALEKLRKALIKSAKRSRGPARTVWLSGSPGDPPVKVGRYKGHFRGVDAAWIAYKPSLLSKPEVFCANPVDLGPLDVPELHVRGLSLRLARDLGFVEVDPHDPVTRSEWAIRLNDHYATAEDFAEAVKDYYSRAVDNLVAFYDSLNAVEDRSFLRQEVTRSEVEVTETEEVATKAPGDKTPAEANRS